MSFLPDDPVDNIDIVSLPYWIEHRKAQSVVRPTLWHERTPVAESHSLWSKNFDGHLALKDDWNHRQVSSGTS